MGVIRLSYNVKKGLLTEQKEENEIVTPFLVMTREKDIIYDKSVYAGNNYKYADFITELQFEYNGADFYAEFGSKGLVDIYIDIPINHFTFTPYFLYGTDSNKVSYINPPTQSGQLANLSLEDSFHNVGYFRHDEVSEVIDTSYAYSNPNCDSYNGCEISFSHDSTTGETVVNYRRTTSEQPVYLWRPPVITTGSSLTRQEQLQVDSEIGWWRFNASSHTWEKANTKTSILSKYFLLPKDLFNVTKVLYADVKFQGITSSLPTIWQNAIGFAYFTGHDINDFGYNSSTTYNNLLIQVATNAEGQTYTNNAYGIMGEGINSFTTYPGLVNVYAQVHMVVTSDKI